jgi:hypothetical protein
MMSRRRFRLVTFFGVFFFLIFGFQNCAQSPQDMALGGSNQLTQASEGEGSLAAVDLNQNVERIEVPESPELEQTLRSLSSKTTYSGERLFLAHTLFIYPQTGLIDVVDSRAGEKLGQNFCLKSEQVHQLQGILAAARICEAKNIESPDLMCTMEYEFPYAKLYLLNQKVHLGEKFSGCHQGADLCGDYSALMKTFILEVKSQLPSLACGFQGL